MGNPNVGKSVVFNRLTGANVMVANYPGTTVEYTAGKARVGGRDVEVVDVPGTYSLDPGSKAEEVACEMLENLGPDGVIVNVVDSTNLERGLNLTLQLLKKRRPAVVALNIWDETAHRGIKIDAAALEGELGVACVPLVAITGEGLPALVARVQEARVSAYDFPDGERWHEVGRIVEQVQQVTHRHHTLLERLGDASVRPVSGFVIAGLVLAATFGTVRLIGEGLIEWIFDPLLQRAWTPVILGMSAAMGGRGLLHDLLIGRMAGGTVDFGESMGVLTTGVYVEATVLAYVSAFYVVLSVLEDSGFLPRMAVLADNVLHKIGLHGMGVVPMLLGLGCNVPGAMATRIMESERDRFIAMVMMAIGVPCMAQMAMIVGLAGKHGPGTLAIVFGTLFLVWMAVGLVMGKLVKGESPEILMDIPPYRVPHLAALAKKVRVRIWWFVREAVPWVMAGVLFVNLLYVTGVVGWIGAAAAPVVSGIMGLPREAVVGMVVGFLRKDVAVGMLMPLHLTAKQVIIASVVLSMYFPCAAAFAVMVREMGWRNMGKAAAVMILASVLVGGALNLLL